ncbi:MAG TPA: phosphatase PAP2 family protein [Candidatus Dormibacteraeota bacterium]|nr:phosphatase PAP2 family protein [Candidatus Dormibacteraeota bacterium]
MAQTPSVNSGRKTLFPPRTRSVRRPLLAVAAAAAVVAAGLTAAVIANPYWPLDDSIDRSIQSVDWGPLTLTFPFFSWLGGPGGIYMQVVVILLVLLLNRRALPLALASLVGGLSYLAIVNLVHRPRPTTAQILRVTEHPGSTSFPSGHLIFITISVAVLMLCLGHRYLPKWARPIGWALVAAIVLAVGLDRIYVGAHWPSDVLAGASIATAWVALVTSVRWLSHRALDRDAA